MSSSEREPLLPWLLSLTGAEGVPLITHRRVAILLGLLAFKQLILALSMLPFTALASSQNPSLRPIDLLRAAGHNNSSQPCPAKAVQELK